MAKDRDKAQEMIQKSGQMGVPVIIVGDEIVVGFNPGYLLDALKVIPKDELEIEVLGPDKPAVMRIEDWYVYLVLPMQLA